MKNKLQFGSALYLYMYMVVITTVVVIVPVTEVAKLVKSAYELFNSLGGIFRFKAMSLAIIAHISAGVLLTTFILLASNAPSKGSELEDVFLSIFDYFNFKFNYEKKVNHHSSLSRCLAVFYFYLS